MNRDERQFPRGINSIRPNFFPDGLQARESPSTTISPWETKILRLTEALGNGEVKCNSDQSVSTWASLPFGDLYSDSRSLRYSGMVDGHRFELSFGKEKSNPNQKDKLVEKDISLIIGTEKIVSGKGQPIEQNISQLLKNLANKAVMAVPPAPTEYDKSQIVDYGFTLANFIELLTKEQRNEITRHTVSSDLSYSSKFEEAEFRGVLGSQQFVVYCRKGEIKAHPAADPEAFWTGSNKENEPPKKILEYRGMIFPKADTAGQAFQVSNGTAKEIFDHLVSLHRETALS